MSCNADVQSSPEQQVATTNNKSLILRGKTFLLTYPQNVTKKEEALQRILQFTWPHTLEWVIVSEEEHKSGDPHLHVAVHFQNSIYTRNANYFDFICQKHGDYKVSRSLKGTVNYVVKDGNYVSHGIDITKFQSKNIGNKIAQIIEKGESLMSIKNENPGYFLLHKRKIEDYQSWFVKKTYRPPLPWNLINLEALIGPDLKIAKWLNKNLFLERQYGTKDLFVHGPTMLGKTTLINSLRKRCRTYTIPSEDFYCNYDDEDYDLAIYDEFKGQKPIQWFNEWCQAGEMHLKKKGVTGYLKKKHIPTMIVSNFALHECYSKAYSENARCLDPLIRRLKIVELRVPIKIVFDLISDSLE